MRDDVTLLTARGIDTRGVVLAGSVLSDEAVRHGGAYLVELVATAQRGDRFKDERTARGSESGKRIRARGREVAVIGIVKLALRRPYTFVVMALLIMIFGVASALRTPTDIFPNINIPVISVVFSYTGLPKDSKSRKPVAVYIVPKGE